MRGKVLWFSHAKGYGFLAVDGHDDVFVHIGAVQRSGLSGLKTGQEIEFEMATSKANGRPCAVDLSVVSDGVHTHAA